MSLIGSDDTWMLFAIAFSCVALAIYLEEKYLWAKKITATVLVMIFGMTLSNLKIIPMNATAWDIVWDYIVPLAIPLLLLQCDIRKIGKDTGRLLIIFLFGSVGTFVGAILAFYLLKDYIPELNKLSGIFTGTYIGGTVNFVALSMSVNVSEEMISIAMIADNLLMALYFFVLLAMPSINFFRNNYRHPFVDEVEKGETCKEEYKNNHEISIKHTALNIALAFVIVAFSKIIANVFSIVFQDSFSISSMLNAFLGNEYLWITTISIILATTLPHFIGEIKGANEIGTLFIYIFFFVIGAPASIILIIQKSPLLLLFAAIIVLVNMIFSLLFGKLFNFTLEEIILASNANIGGPTTATAMAVSKGWNRLIGPIIIIGTFGYVIGTYCGLIIGFILGV